MLIIGSSSECGYVPAGRAYPRDTRQMTGCTNSAFLATQDVQFDNSWLTTTLASRVEYRLISHDQFQLTVQGQRPYYAVIVLA